MRAGERASRPNHQPLPAHLDPSALLTIRFIPRYEEFAARFSLCLGNKQSSKSSPFRINGPNGTNQSVILPFAGKPFAINGSNG